METLPDSRLMAQLFGRAKKTPSTCAEQLQEVRDYSETRALRLAVTEQRLLTRIDEVADGDVTLSQVSNAFAVIHTAGRLERGQSTQNINSICSIAERLERREAPEAQEAPQRHEDGLSMSEVASEATDEPMAVSDVETPEPQPPVASSAPKKGSHVAVPAPRLAERRKRLVKRVKLK